MDMPGRDVGTDYAFGNNGQMKEGEMFDGAYSADYWSYDSRLGRRWEMDPMAYAWQSPYVTFDNSPISLSDAEGLRGGPETAVAVAKAKPMQAKAIGRAVNASAEKVGVKIGTSMADEVLTTSLKWGSRCFGVLVYVFTPLETGSSATPFRGELTFPSTHEIPPIEYFGDNPNIIPKFHLDEIKRRVEAGKGTPNDYKIYDKLFPPTGQVPYKTQSHHLIPTAVFSEIDASEIVKKALEFPGFSKELKDGDWNRLDLGTDVHGNHPAYSDYIRRVLEDLSIKNPNISPYDATVLLKNLAGRLRGDILDKIKKNPGKRLNEIYGGGKSKTKSKPTSKPSF